MHKPIRPQLLVVTLLFVITFLVPRQSVANAVVLATTMSMGASHSATNCQQTCMAASRSAGDTAMNKTMMDMMKANASLKLSGEQDRDFMLMMIAHHQAALDMARAQLAHGKHLQLQALARNILNTQQKEIQEMRRWLHEWYGE